MTRIVIELGEYQHRWFSVHEPTEADLRLAKRLMGVEGNARLVVRWLVNGEVDITASSWVGVVRFTRLDVHVVPKLVGGALRVLRMLDYSAGVSMLCRLPLDRPLSADGRDLFELICLLLARETEVLIRDGLLRDYRLAEDTIQVLRGRLRYRDQYLRRTIARQRLRERSRPNLGISGWEPHPPADPRSPPHVEACRPSLACAGE
jgi:5-methylcytosine-specific restriction enzyme subunit McrC